jgi:ubiquinone biosynthesis protein Coq4
MRHETKAGPTFVAKIRVDDKVRLEQLKQHPRETYGDVVHWLIAAEFARRDDGRPQPEHPEVSA